MCFFNLLSADVIWYQLMSSVVTWCPLLLADVTWWWLLPACCKKNCKQSSTPHVFKDSIMYSHAQLSVFLVTCLSRSPPVCWLWRSFDFVKWKKEKKKRYTCLSSCCPSDSLCTDFSTYRLLMRTQVGFTWKQRFRWLHVNMVSEHQQKRHFC